MSLLTNLLKIWRELQHDHCNPTSGVRGGWCVHNLTPLPCEGREFVSNRPSVEIKIGYERKYSSEEVMLKLMGRRAIANINNKITEARETTSNNKIEE